jgi:membrane carboxypeptidase/penicillin-binding protein PbpC
MASVVAAGMGALAFAVAPTAAATPVGVAVNCASGNSQLGCSVVWRDADGRVSIRWTVNGRDLPTVDDQTSFRLACVPGDYYAVTAVVADSTGRASDSVRVQCQRA